MKLPTTNKKKKNTNKKPFSILKWASDNSLYLISFIIPVLSMLVVYYLKDVYPFGENMYLRSDCYHQYTPYLEILQEKLKEGGSLFYTWEIGAGMNFIAIAAYYLASPFNLLTIIWPGNMADFVSFSIILKMGLSGFAATYYLSKRFNKRSGSTIAFGMMYALSAYFAALSWNNMWLDCMWLLPFIVLGLDKLVKERKCRMYCISLALAIFSNYYIGIMLCIFSVIYFIYLFCVSDFDSPLGKLKERLITLANYAIYSLLAGGLAACIILPEYYMLLVTKSADSTFPEKLEEFFSLLYMIFRSLVCIPVSDLKMNPDPNIYCGVIIFILVPLFWMCKKINLKERIGKTVLAVIMLLSFNLNIPNYIWHGFHVPNQLPARESFIYIFIIIVIAYEAFIHLKDFKPSQIIKAAGGSLALILVLQELYRTSKIFTTTDYYYEVSMVKIVYLSALFIIIYAAVMLWYKHKPEMKSFITYVLVLVVFCELTLNMNVTSIVSTSNRNGYYEATSAYDSLNETAKKDADAENVKFYRSESVYHATRNDGARFGYDSMSTFCSVSIAAIQDFYDAIGMQTSFNAYSYYGHTPLTASMFSVKYEFSSSEPSLPTEASLLGNTTYLNSSNIQNNLYLYKHKNILPLGYLVNFDTDKIWNNEDVEYVDTNGNSVQDPEETTKDVINNFGGNPFDAQNSFVTTAVTGGKKIFHKLVTNGATITAAYDSSESQNVTNKNPETYDVYFYCPTSSDSLNISVDGQMSDPQFINVGTKQSTTKTFSSTNQNYICRVGNVSAGSNITVTASDGSSISALYAYAFDHEAWDADYNLLAAHSYQVDSFSDTKITGTVTSDKDGMIMYTSIPYDEGWSVYVDDKEVKTTGLCKGALTGVYIEKAGTHTITFKYCPKGFVFGLILTILCLIAFIGLIYVERYFTKKNGTYITSKK